MSSDELNAIIERIESGTQTATDVEALRVALTDRSQDLRQLGKYNVNIGQGQDIHIGDRFYVEWNDEAIQALIQVVRKQLPTPTTGIPENLPRSGVVQFVGREQELETLHQQLQENERVAVSAIAGMGGVGKTELALQYAIKYKQDYSGGICWIQARRADIGTHIVQFARSRLQLNPPEDLNLPEQVGFCWMHWQPGKVLAVLDDVDNYDAIKSYLPPIDHRFKVLITTRLPLGKSIKKLELNVLDEAKALILLESLVEAERIQAEPEAAKELCAWLGNLPLGLELVGRYLDRRRGLSLAEMLVHLKEKRLQARALQHSYTDMTSELGVGAAFELTWDMLDEPTRYLGCLLSLFAQAPISWFLLAAMMETEEELWELQEDRTDLVEWHLLQCLDEETYRLHELIREFLREKLEHSDWVDDLKQTFANFMVALAYHIPYTLDYKALSGIAPTIPHLKEAAERYSELFSDEDLIYPFRGLGRFYESQDLYRSAEYWYERCVTVLKERLGSEHPDFATSLNNLAQVYIAQSRYGKAESLYLESLDILQRTIGDEQPRTAITLMNLGMLYGKLNRFSEAEELCQKALELNKKILGEEDPDLAKSLDNLATLYRMQGRFSEAETLCLRALEIHKRALGEDHPDIETNLGNLADIYYAQGRHSESESIWLQAIELKRRLLGEHHPNVAGSLTNLATLYSQQGRYAEAEPLYLQAIELRRQHPEEADADLALNLSYTATLYVEQGRYSEAEALYLHSLTLRKSLWGEENVDIATNLGKLAILYRIQGRYSEAESLCTQSIELHKRLLGEEHSYVASGLNNLASIYYAQGRFNEAETLYKLALKIVDSESEEALESYRILTNLASCSYVQGKYRESESLYKRALAYFESPQLEKHPNKAIILNNLGLIYSSQECHIEAEAIYMQALEISRETFGEEHPHIAMCWDNLATLHHQQGHYEQAESLYLKALKIRTQFFGEVHPDVAVNLNNLAFLYRELGRYDKAESLYLKSLEINQRLLAEEHPSIATCLDNLGLLYCNTCSRNCWCSKRWVISVSSYSNEPCSGGTSSRRRVCRLRSTNPSGTYTCSVR